MAQPAESRDRRERPVWQDAARRIDHTLLHPDATREEIVQLCSEAVNFGMAAVCVQPCWAALAVSLLRTTPVKVAGVVGFPHGATLGSVKRYEAAELIRLGADELDMVINVGELLSGGRIAVENDIRGTVEVAHAAGAMVKVILETALLNHDQKVLACELAVAAGADFVKTSTGFASAGATIEDVALLRATVGERAGVKAAGGIRDAAKLLAMVEAGADRIGSSASVEILREMGAAQG
jgi:deoxyribose-phosphate aldolase